MPPLPRQELRSLELSQWRRTSVAAQVASQHRLAMHPLLRLPHQSATLRRPHHPHHLHHKSVARAQRHRLGTCLLEREVHPRRASLPAFLRRRPRGRFTCRPCIRRARFLSKRTTTIRALSGSRTLSMTRRTGTKYGTSVERALVVSRLPTSLRCRKGGRKERTSRTRTLRPTT